MKGRREKMRWRERGSLGNGKIWKMGLKSKKLQGWNWNRNNHGSWRLEIYADATND